MKFATLTNMIVELVEQYLLLAKKIAGESDNIPGLSHEEIEMSAQEALLKAAQHFMPPADSDMAVQLFKDPYLFDFLGTADPRREAEVEKALIDHIQKFLIELGTGFAFVGRQVRFEVGGKDYPLDHLRHPKDQPTIGLLLCRKKNLSRPRGYNN